MHIVQKQKKAFFQITFRLHLLLKQLLPIVSKNVIFVFYNDFTFIRSIYDFFNLS